MEKIKQQIEETKEEIRLMRANQDTELLNNNEVIVCRMGGQINYRIGLLNGLRIALTLLEEENGK